MEMTRCLKCLLVVLDVVVVVVVVDVDVDVVEVDVVLDVWRVKWK